MASLVGIVSVQVVPTVVMVDEDGGGANGGGDLMVAVQWARVGDVSEKRGS